MSIRISVPALWDKEFNFLNDALVNVNGDSTVVGEVQQPDKVYPPSATPTLKTVLQITDPTFGTLYLDVSLAVYQALLRAASSTGGGSVNKTSYYTISEDGGNSITDEHLLGATLLLVWKGGAILTVGVDVDLEDDKLVFSGLLAKGDTVGVLYYN